MTIEVFNINLLTAFAVTVFKGTSQNAVGYQSGTSQKAEHRPFGPNVLTLQERILEFCTEPKSLREIADFLGAANKKKVKAKYIDNILGTKIVMTVPDKPNSRLQKYVTVKLP
jgi:ATP-dependent DNA helicase RecG